MVASAYCETPVIEIFSSQSQLPLESDLPIHGSINWPEVIEAEPIVIVVEPLMIPATTTSLLPEASTERKTAGLEAVPEADQSFELLRLYLLLNSPSDNTGSKTESISLSANGAKLTKVKDSIIRIAVNRLKDFVSDMGSTMLVV